MSVLNHKSHSSEHIERIHYYSPPVPDLKPRKSGFNTGLKIGLIGSERIYDGLKFEAEVFILTEDNCNEVLQYIELDFILVESCMQTVTGHWEYAQAEGTEKNQKLKEVIRRAKDKSIQTVYWFTQDHAYHDNYKKFASEMDYIFCSDVKEIELLNKEGMTATVLKPAVQPVIYNPFKQNEYYSDLEIGVLFDGWADLYRYEKDLNLLQKIKAYDLKIIDSKKEIFHNKLKDLPEYAKNILGCVSQESKRTLLKYSKTVVTFASSLATPTSQQWDALEVVASRANLLYHGTLDSNDVRKNIALETETDEEMLSTLESFEENEIFREKLAHKGWREVNQKHTFNIRLITICETLGIDADNKINAIASLITPTYRAANMMQSIKTFEQQSYTNKELVLVYNGSDKIPDEVSTLCEKNEQIKLVTLPPENSVGRCLNFGHSTAKGDFCFRVDDDDIYAENYIMDMMLYLRIADYELFGRPPGYITLEGSPQVYARKNNINALSIVAAKDVLEGKVYLGGNTIGGNRSFLLKNPYPDFSFGAADTSLLLEASKNTTEILIMDSFNMLVIRRSDLSSHTWRVDFEKMKRNLIELKNDTNVFV